MSTFGSESDFTQVFKRVASLLRVADPNQIEALLRTSIPSIAQPVDRLLLEGGLIDEPTRQLLERLTRYHLERAGGRLEPCLKHLSEGPLGLLGYDIKDIPEGRPASAKPARNESPGDQETQCLDSHQPRPPDPTEPTQAWQAGPSSAGPAGDPPGTRDLGEAELAVIILKPLAHGGLGEVFLARDTSLNRQVALKVILRQHSDDPRLRARFVTEAEIAGSLEHPGIVPVYSKGRYPDGRPYYTMRLIRGDTLKQAITRFHEQENVRFDSMEFRRLVGILIGACRAIAYAHSQKVVHRDLKPSNIGIGDFGESVVLDWGLAKRYGAADFQQLSEPRGTTIAMADPSSGTSPTWMGEALGTPQFMSPEQAAGDLDLVGPRSDIYSLGATLYSILTGKPPLEGVGNLTEVVRRAKEGEIPPPRTLSPAVPRALDAICQRAMSHEPHDRPESALELADNLERWLADEPIPGVQDSVWDRVRRWEKRNRVMVRIGGAALAAVAAIAVGAAVTVEGARRVAVSRGSEAQEARKRAESSEQELGNQTARLALEHGADLGESGDCQEALLWCSRALSLNGNSGTLEDLGIRRNIAAWGAVIPRLQHVLQHDGPVRSLSLSPDGATVATASSDGTAGLWFVETGAPVCEALRHLGPVNQVDYSPDGASVLTVSDDGTAVVWNAETGRPRFESRVHESPVILGSFSPNGQWFATVTSKGELRLWNTVTGEPTTPSLRNAGRIVTLAWSPDSNLVAIGMEDRRVRIWASESGELRNDTLRTKGIRVSALAFSPDGKLLAAGSANRGILEVWEVETGKSLLESQPLPSPLLALGFSRDGSRIITGCYDSGVGIWTVADGMALSVPAVHRSQVNGVSLSPDGDCFVTSSSDNTAVVWDLEQGRPLDPAYRHPGAVLDSRLTPGGRFVITACTDGAARIWSRPEGLESGRPLPQGSLIRAPLRFLPDGTGLVTASEAGVLTVFDYPSGKIRFQRQAHRGTIWTLEVSPDGTSVATGGNDGRVGVWDSQTGVPRWEPKVLGSQVRRLTISRDGKMLAAAAFDRKLYVCGMATGQAILEPLTLDDRAVCLQFSKSGSLAFGTANGDLQVWDVASGGGVRGPARHENAIRDLAISPDGSLIATASIDNTACLWNSETLERVGPPLVHQGNVWTVCFDPSGTRLLTACFDGRSRLWNVSTGQAILSPMRHDDMIYTAGFSPDGRTIASVSRDACLKLWDTESGTAIGPIRKQSPPSLSFAFHPDGKTIACSSGDNTVRFWQVSEPLPGKPEELEQRFQQETGMTINNSGQVEVLTGESWLQRFSGAETQNRVAEAH